MSFNQRSSGGKFGGGRFGGGGGGFRNGAPGYVNCWLQSNAGFGHPISYPQQGPPPAPLANMATNVIELLQSTNGMPASGFTERPNWNSHWGGNSPRISSMGMRRQYSQEVYTKDNRQRGDDKFGSSSKSGLKDSNKRKSKVKATDGKKKGQSEREKTKEQLEADKKASYVGVPSAVLYCHVCTKHMWDAESFVKHIRGRRHEEMMTFLDKEYRMRVDIMRHQIKAVENQREIDLYRVANKNKLNGNKNSVNPNPPIPLSSSNYCLMCNVHIYGPLAGHRRSDRHRKLKDFLHPECKLCDALFHNRLEMDEHKLTAGHLMKVAEWRSINHPHLKDDEFDIIDLIKIEEEENDNHDQMPIAKKYEMLEDRDANKLELELEGGASNEKKEQEDALANKTDKTVDENDVKNNKSETLNINAVEDSTAILQANKNEISATIDKQAVAAYDPNVAIGKELLVPSIGFVCRLCNCFLLDQQRVSIHCQTAAHYINYTTMTKLKEATSGGKKRGIDEVNKSIIDATGDDITQDNDNEVILKVEPQKTIITDSKEPTAKRMKIEEIHGDIVKMETDKVKSTENVAESSIDKKPDKTASPIPISAIAVKGKRLQQPKFVEAHRSNVAKRDARR